MKPVAIAIVIAFPVAWIAMDNWRQDFAYRVPISWIAFAIAGVAAILIGLIAISFQSVKSAIANPIKSLRSE